MAQSQPVQSYTPTHTNGLAGKNSEIAKYLLPEDPNSARSRAVWGQLQADLPKILETFYAELQSVPTLKQKLGNDPKAPGRLSALQTTHWERVFNADIDQTVEKEARKIGAAHVRIGLTSDWFIASYGRILMEAIPTILKAHRFTPQRATGALQVLVSRVFMDMALANESYASQTTDHEAHEWREDNDYQNLRTISGAMTDLNDVTTNLAKLTDSTQKTSSSSESVAAAVEELVASIRQLSETSQSAAQEATDTNEALNDGVKGVAQAREAIQTVSQTASRSNESLSSLQSAAGEISSFMEVIQSIADQTNLLALNATIEAARAGEAGKGFAVVASEVKDLANQAAKATEDVAKRIATLQEGIDLMNEHFGATRTAIETGESTLENANRSIETAGHQMNSVASRMNEVASILEQQDASASEIGGHITRMTDMSRHNSETLSSVSDMLQHSNDGLSEAALKWFRNSSGRSMCEMAKIDHVLFKKRVVDTILGRGSWKASEVPDHHNCRLGKWYDSITDKDLREQISFRTLDEPHHRVHAAAVETLKAHEAGNTAKTLDHLEELEAASREVINGLNDVSKFLHSKESISERRKRERQPVFGERARIKSNGRDFEANVIDEAKRGIGIEGVSVHDIGQELEIEYKGPKRGVVRWSNGKRGGVEFQD